ncbi:MAG TPA: hypothetical protein VKA45_07120 [Gaiellaceae bacterium]|nr:hypothetical protein [Gaiellaceae bacterium]
MLALAGAAPASVDTPADVRTLVAEIERMHPNPYHYLSRAEFHGAADEFAARAPGWLNELVQAA